MNLSYIRSYRCQKKCGTPWTWVTPKYESGISNCCINLAKRSVWRWAREIIQAGGLFLWFEWVLGTDFGQRSAMNWAESFGGILRDRDGPKACERKNGGHGQVASGHPCHIMLVSNQCRKWDLIWNNIILVWFQHIGSIVFTLVWCQQMMLAFKIKSYVSIMWLRTNDSSDSITYGLPLSNLRLLQVAETWEPSVDHDKFKVYELYLHSTPRWKNQ